MEAIKLVKKAMFKYGRRIKKKNIYNGQIMYLDSKDNGLHKNIYVDGIREENALKYFLSSIKPSDNILDLGANIGFYVIQEAEIVNSVIGIEPSQRNFAFLELNTLVNNLDNVKNYNLAISKTNGLINFFEAKAGNLSAINRMNESHEYTEIKATSLNGKKFLEDYKLKCNVLRMDVEGAELEVLLSFKDRLNDFDNIFLEVHENYLKDKVHELFCLLEKNGFNELWYVPDEKSYDKFEKQIVTIEELKKMNREEVYHLFCFKR